MLLSLMCGSLALSIVTERRVAGSTQRIPAIVCRICVTPNNLKKNLHSATSDRWNASHEVDAKQATGSKKLLEKIHWCWGRCYELLYAVTSLNSGWLWHNFIYDRSRSARWRKPKRHSRRSPCRWFHRYRNLDRCLKGSLAQQVETDNI